MELRMNEVVLSGRIVQGPTALPDETTHFLLQAGEEGEPPIHCFGEGVSVERLRQYCQKGDEISLEGRLESRTFANEKSPRLLVKVRFISYGRKDRTLRTNHHLG